MMKAMGSGKRGPMAGIAQAMGFGGGMKPPSAEEMKAMAEKMQGGAGRAACPNCPRIFPLACVRACRTCRASPGSAASRPCRASAAFPGKKK